MEINTFGSLGSEISPVILKKTQAPSTSTTHNVEVNFTAMIEKLEEEIRSQDAPTERLQEEDGEVFDEVTEEAKDNTVPLVASAWTEGLDGVPEFCEKWN